jgi:hypothetical protein
MRLEVNSRQNIERTQHLKFLLALSFLPVREIYRPLDFVIARDR